MAQVHNTEARAPSQSGRELEDIQRSREDAAGLVREWLDARQAQLAGEGEVELTIMGLGDQVPPPGFEPPIGL